MVGLPLVSNLRQNGRMGSDQPADVATLGANGAKARFGVAYLRAVCSQAGVGFNETAIDEDVLAIDGEVQFAVAPARVQVKCTGRFRIEGGETASWPAESAWWEKWKKSCLPVYLVLLVVDPDDRLLWLDHRSDGTFQCAAAFWVRVDKTADGASVQIPKKQRLTADTLKLWAADVEACFSSSEG
jgi:Domain of unknown function (DUF4365)